MTTPIWFDSPRPMSLGLMMPMREQAMAGDTARFSDLLAIAQAARESRFEVLWFADHLIFEPETGPAGNWEAFTTIAAIAATVPDIHLGTMVACAGLRNPGLLARTAETLDEISDGRFILGLGAGWNEPEYRQFGYPFAGRAGRLEDVATIVYQLLRSGTSHHAGRHEHTDHAINRPQGPSGGRIPILIGANGPRNLRVTARFADAWNGDHHATPEEWAALQQHVDAACDDIGRDRASLIRTGMAPFGLPGMVNPRPGTFTGTPDEAARQLLAFAATGLRHMVIGLNPRTAQGVRDFAATIAAYDAALQEPTRPA